MSGAGVMTPPRRDLPAVLVRMEQASSQLEAQCTSLGRRLEQVRKRLEAALEEKQRLAGLLDSVLESIEAGVILLGPEGRIMAANAAARRAGAVQEGTDGSRLHPAIGGLEAFPALIRPEGESGPAWDLRESALRLAGLGQGRLLLVQDVTRLLRLEERARRRSRLEALGRMAAEVAHEVRNPLGSLELCATLLIEDLDDRPDDRELAEQILLGVRRLSGTVHRLLSSVRGGPARTSVQDPCALGREIRDFVRPVARARGIALSCVLPSEALRARIDGEGLRQALLNLLGNAFDAAGEGGRVRLELRAAHDGLLFEVGDSGPGIPPEAREAVLEAFYSTREEGTGLGLAVVDAVATAHGGRVEIGQAPEGGALLRLCLPGVLVQQGEQRA